MTLQKKEFFKNHAGSSYQDRDCEVVDYQMYKMPGIEQKLRGPSPKNLSKGAYVACVGAAQVFGCFCQKPFPQILSERLNVDFLNLGIGGAGPKFFLRPKFIEIINNARFVILQVMSGRSEDNAIFSTFNGSGGILLHKPSNLKFCAYDAYNRFLVQELQDKSRLLKPFYKIFGTKKARLLIKETRANWIHSYKLLFEQIKVPVVLFWFSKRSSYYRELFVNSHTLFGEFPQLVNKAMIAEIRKYADDYVECVSDRGSPQPLVSRFTGKEVAVSWSGEIAEYFKEKTQYNKYYPSPEMHQDAAFSLEGTCQKLLFQK